jgi:hypothetical protein
MDRHAARIRFAKKYANAALCVLLRETDAAGWRTSDPRSGIDAHGMPRAIGLAKKYVNETVCVLVRKTDSERGRAVAA